MKRSAVHRRSRARAGVLLLATMISGFAPVRAADFSVERSVLARFAEKTGGADAVVLREDGETACPEVANSPEELRADWRGGQNGYDRDLAGHYHVELCPSNPGGLDLILRQRAAVLDLFADVSVGNVCIFPYDQGGCTCSACAPWGRTDSSRSSRRSVR